MRYPGTILDIRVLPLLVVDNSAFPHIRLTAWETRRILASREVLPSPIFSSEDRYAHSCLRIPARGLPPFLSGTVMAS